MSSPCSHFRYDRLRQRKEVPRHLHPDELPYPQVGRKDPFRDYLDGHRTTLLRQIRFHSLDELVETFRAERALSAPKHPFDRVDVDVDLLRLNNGPTEGPHLRLFELSLRPMTPRKT